jgi:hypothetical protein
MLLGVTRLRVRRAIVFFSLRPASISAVHEHSCLVDFWRIFCGWPKIRVYFMDAHGMWGAEVKAL